MRGERWIQFLSAVNGESFGLLVEIFQNAVLEGVERLHLLLSTPGGSVSYGLTLYALMRGLPIEVWTYNIGQVDSIGVVLYCAGKRRLAAPQTRFLLHGIRTHLEEGNYTGDQLRNILTELESDQRNICRVLAESTGQTLEKVEADLSRTVTLLPEQAREYRLVDEIVTEIIPPQARLTTIFLKEEKRSGRLYNLEWERR
ncbi:protease subunit of ATP-dependent Clp proteases [Bellilinea caldifistulae]|jgi:ATP-dependent protease ClpP protease subunit|uniref:ClpP family protease n=1 Tax=Bellilinea caldifistulae TaxID=360411 RepID=UPI0007862039|nr:ATP-dependent Clp protease proteolytic subunit [Bellilinea caldifistulae]GAP12220.1 protease subunit of ATP-dependent Clp proteases [Bellilinea caldifistulae]